MYTECSRYQMLMVNLVLDPSTVSPAEKAETRMAIRAHLPTCSSCQEHLGSVGVRWQCLRSQLLISLFSKRMPFNAGEIQWLGAHFKEELPRCTCKDKFQEAKKRRKERRPYTHRGIYRSNGNTPFSIN